MRRVTLVIATIVALGIMGGVAIATSGGIISPEDWSTVEGGPLELEAEDREAAAGGVEWSVRLWTADGIVPVAGNMDGFDDEYTWVDGAFSATVDTTGWASGLYLFVFDPAQGDRHIHRFDFVAGDPDHEDDEDEGGDKDAGDEGGDKDAGDEGGDKDAGDEGGDKDAGDEGGDKDAGDEAEDQGGGETDPHAGDECRNGGWQDLGFRNQGQCISDAASDGQSGGNGR